MPLTYWIGAETLPTIEESLFENAEVLLYDPRRERGTERVGDRLRQLDCASWQADLVIIRGAADLYEDLITDGALKTILAGVPTMALCPPTDGPDLTPTLSRVPWAIEPPADAAIMDMLAERGSFIDALREWEISSMLRRNGAIWRDNAEHFALPSGRHASAFIRIAGALQDIVDVSRLADWVLPHVRRSSVVLGDTGSILQLLLQVQLRTRDRFDWRTHVDTLPEYPRAPEQLTAALREVLTHGGTDVELVLVSSVTSSGNLVRAVANLLPSGVHLRAVSICDTTPTGEPDFADAVRSNSSAEAIVLCREPIERWIPREDGKCVRCDSAEIYDIDPRTYVRRPYRKPQAILLKRDVVAEHKDLWEAAQRADAVQLHYNAQVSAGRTRHHAVYLDVPALLSDATFRDLTLASLRDFLPEPPNLVLIPDHAGTEQLMALVVNAWDDTVSSHAVPQDSMKLNAIVADEVATARHVLLLDDAVVTGHAFNWLNKLAYGARGKTATKRTMHGYALVLRPDNLGTAKWMRRFLTGRQGPRFGSAFELLLPGERSCPWCAEKELLGRWRDRIPVGRDLVDARIARLDSPIEPPLLLGGDPVDAGLMTEGSFVGRLDQRVAFAAFSAAVWQQAQVLDNSGYAGARSYYSLELVFDAYYDTVFAAAAFRTLSTLQMRHAEQDAFITERLSTHIPHAIDMSYLSELAMAAATGKLPDEGVRHILQARAAHPIALMWLDVLSNMLGSR